MALAKGFKVGITDNINTTPEINLRSAIALSLLNPDSTAHTVTIHVAFEPGGQYFSSSETASLNPNEIEQIPFQNLVIPFAKFVMVGKPSGDLIIFTRE